MHDKLFEAVAVISEQLSANPYRTLRKVLELRQEVLTECKVDEFLCLFTDWAQDRPLIFKHSADQFME